MVKREQPARLEGHTIQPIAPDQRHGRARDLFTVWFGSNIMLLTIVTGALATKVYGLSFAWAVASLVVGNLLGAVFMALHAAQGARLGVPQMVQTRGQFGAQGSLLVVAVVIVMYLGFFASNLVVGGEALHLILPGLSETAGILLIGTLSVLGAVYGHDLIHAYNRVMTYVSGLVLALAFVWIVGVHGLPADFSARNGFSAAGALGTVSLAALWQIAYAPYVSDYSRYLPVDTGPRDAFWASFWGCSLGSLLPMLLGAVAGLCLADLSVMQALVALTDGFAPVVLITFAVGMAATNAMNVYCGALSCLTFGQTLAPAWSPRAAARAGFSVILCLISFAMALWAKDSFLASYESFLSLLLYVLVPWTAINLVDYYYVQHGSYDVAAFMRADGGIYGRYNVPALVCYALGILVQLPFMVTHVYRGPLADALGGADIAWLVGLGVTAPVYYVMARRIPVGG